MRLSSSHLRRFVSWAAAPLAIVLAAGLVWQASYSAFSADTRNSGNSWSTRYGRPHRRRRRFSSVQRHEPDPGTDGDRVHQGHVDVDACSGPSSCTRLNAVNSVGLAEYIKVTVTQGDGGTFASCTGFVADSAGVIVNARTLAYMAANYSTYATGVGGWTTSSQPGVEDLPDLVHLRYDRD